MALSVVTAEDVESIVDRAAPALRRLEGATVVVAGGAGFLPSYFVDALALANERLLGTPLAVVCLDNYSTGVPERLAHLADRADVEFVQADVSRAVGVDTKVDYVLHGASIASPTWYRRRPLETIDVNVGGTRRLLELAREHGARGFLYLSSSEIYGDPPPERIPTSEEYWGHVSPTGPRACYDESKRLAETLCVTYHGLYGLPVKIVRPFNVYGPRLRLDDGRLVPDLIRDALERRSLTLYSDGRATRSFCYITDFVVAALLLLVEGAPGEAFNVGNDEEVTVQQVAELVGELAGVEVEHARSSDEHYLTDNPSRRCPDLRKTKAAIDWEPIIGLRDGLRRTLEYYRAEALA